ncbi:MAG: carbamate kinase [Solirubrobacterales bacterium]|nr:carbamate kinase [Solirubrobacterales bacterium]
MTAPSSAPSNAGIRRLVIALGGNALATAQDAGPRAQQAAVEVAMEQVAELVASGYEIAITHGNGPQVGNLMLKNELARDVVPAVPLDWCVAQTQATIGYLIATALERSLARRGIERAIAVLVTRVLVDARDPAFSNPSKPIGNDRRLVASPEPQRVLDEASIVRLLDDGGVVVGAGGGGVPMVLEQGALRGVEAVIDKDLCAALLADHLAADALVIATDVPGVALELDSDRPRWLGRISADRLGELHRAGTFPAGSMGPKVEACLRFVRAGVGRRASIAALQDLGGAVAGERGTIVVGGSG